MSWTAKTTSITKDSKHDAAVTVIYTNGTDTITETIAASSPAIIDQQIKNKVAQFQVVDDYIATKTPGDVDLTPPTPKVPDAPTPLQIYQIARSALIQTKEDLDLGLITQDEYNKAVGEVMSLKKST